MIDENLSLIRARIVRAAVKSGRDAGDIRIVAVTKTVGVNEILKISGLGIKEIGENRVQEAFIKYQKINATLSAQNSPFKWHMLGRLQTNKCARAVEMFDLIQSVDSLRIAVEIDKHAAKKNKIQECLVEIKVSGEPKKTGFEIPVLADFMEKSSQLKNIRIRGIMAMAPLLDEPEKTRHYFRRAFEIYRENAGRMPFFNILSMGMSGDFEIAVEEGSNMVRIGTAIFGEKVN